MAWKIIFSYQDGGKIEISSSQRKLTKDRAKHYQKKYAKSNNDGGMLYMSLHKKSVPISLEEYIKK